MVRWDASIPGIVSNPFLKRETKSTEYRQIVKLNTKFSVYMAELIEILEAIQFIKISCTDKYFTTFSDETK